MDSAALFALIAKKKALRESGPDLLKAAKIAFDCLSRPEAERDEQKVRLILEYVIAKAEGL
jgi:hypothetical protein